MRRITFYIVVALLAFGIGSFFAIYFYQTSSLKTTVKETPTESTIVENINDKMTEAKFSCEDEATKAVWNKLEEDKIFIEDAYSVIEAREIKNCQELFERYSVDLNDDNVSEIVLKGSYILFCNSAGDCRTWIISKIGGEYRIVFDGTTGDSKQGLQFLQEKANKFQNLKIKLNNGLAEDNIGVYKFDGNQYRIKKCFEDVNSVLDFPFDYQVHDEKLVSVKLDKCL